MKSKIITLMFSGLLAGCLAVAAQDSPTAATTAAGGTVTSTAPAPAPAEGAETASTNVVAQPDDAASTNAVIVDAQPGTIASADATPAQTSAAVIPLIVMDDVPLTDAIRNLARQANINYMLDPRVSFGQPGPQGQPAPQPNVSIRWENVTAEQALNALLQNYGLQLVEDSKTKIGRVTIKDPAAPDPLFTKTIQLKYASPSNILASVQTALIDPRSRIYGDTRTSQLVVRATEKELEALEQLVVKLDLPTKQVLIEAKLLETSLNPSSIKGIDWSPTLAAQNVRIGNNALPGVPPQAAVPPIPGPGGTIIPGTPATAGTIGGIIGSPGLLGQLTGKFFNPAQAFLNADGVNAVVSFLNRNSDARVIATPRAVTLDNETANLSVTRAVPIINVTAGTANTTGGSQITYTNLGVILNVTPRISANNFVNLRVVPEVSRVFATVSKSINNAIFEADIYDVRRIETRVMVPSGNTLVMGGLVQDDIRSENSKVPLLGDLPGVGLLFRRDTKAREKSNLLIFITPTIVQDTDFQVTKSDFLKTPLVNEYSKDWSWWNSGKPADWSRLVGRDEPQY